MVIYTLSKYYIHIIFSVTKPDTHYLFAFDWINENLYFLSGCGQPGHINQPAHGGGGACSGEQVTHSDTQAPVLQWHHWHSGAARGSGKLFDSPPQTQQSNQSRQRKLLSLSSDVIPNLHKLAQSIYYQFLPSFFLDDDYHHVMI